MADSGGMLEHMGSEPDPRVNDVEQLSVSEAAVQKFSDETMADLFSKCREAGGPK